LERAARASAEVALPALPYAPGKTTNSVVTNISLHISQKPEFPTNVNGSKLPMSTSIDSSCNEEPPMAKGILATAALLAVTAAATVPAQPDDGCEILKELVKASVHTSATEFAVDGPAVRVHTVGRGGAVGSTIIGRQACGGTIEVTTKAFSESLAALSMPVGWNGQHPMDRGDYCLSHDLRQCYPSQSPLFPSLSPNQLAFVHGAWKGVRDAVASQMPYGPASNLSQFTSGSLESALGKNLYLSVDGPLYSSYRGGRSGTKLP
jgi:hypothetical protein